ncbi:bifunctional oligoribonuclease/PAP phosphatase NrnA [Carnobacteriaceae bacterium zg-84]|uniref:DHH family phosphoesterase n=1 Tax=Granulicatella sp. zg-84 TaxID=2678503 RepID=UPI0013C1CF62|nr:bifunctional oligoribonuclease/PAP phosphatase NrnA [Granulicatella sp. zg-84]NEW66325.1 bifunctional oligoribonuclease/PAP phosphatase NrnA [Granulicatella sp. zg-84]QMI85390.1 bifunctional oligoribonuclease/PAP phosphatase NrnA [Carnobacteriaceae bacterium zg-84]
MFFKQLSTYIHEHDTIIIHRHTNPDPDALGSQLGLAGIITENFKDKHVYCVGRDINSLAFMGQMDQIDDSCYKNALIIVTDTANTPRIDDKRFTLGKTLVKIDHHPDIEPYGDISYVDTKASSTSEIITQWVYEERLMITSETARHLYAGIVGDTGRFLYESTSRKTMQLASFLRNYDFSATDIQYAMITQSIQTAKLSGYVLQHLKYTKQGVAYIVLSQKLLTKYGLSDEDTAGIVSLPGTIENVCCWGIFVEQPSGKYRCRLRSKGPAINSIAQEHDGGGHPLASGANAQHLDEVKIIISKLKKAAEHYQK